MLAFFGNQLVSGYVRGRQVAEFLEVPFNPPNHNDFTCVWVKRRVEPWWPEKSWVDIMDAADLRGNIRDSGRPVGVIAFTTASYVYLLRFYKRFNHRVVLIPQHHCNFEKTLRPDREVRIVGFVGHKEGLSCGEDELRAGLAEVGLELRCLYFGRSATQCRISRMDVVKFYEDIDIQVSFRWLRGMFHRFKDNVRFLNAGSFGIPSVSAPEGNLLEHFADSAITAMTVTDLVRECGRLKNEPNYYKEMSKRVLEASQAYHISQIAPKYAELD